MVQHSGPGPDPSRDTGHAVVVENREQSSGASRFGPVGATRSQARSPARSQVRRSPRDSRNIAVALALLAFAVLMFLVTIVKFEEQIQRIGLSQPWEATTPPRVRTPYRGSGVAAFFPISDALAASPRFGRPEESVGAVLLWHCTRVGFERAPSRFRETPPRKPK